MSSKMDVLARKNTSTGEWMHNPENFFLVSIAQRESNGNSLLVNNVASSKSPWTSRPLLLLILQALNLNTKDMSFLRCMHKHQLKLSKFIWIGYAYLNGLDDLTCIRWALTWLCEPSTEVVKCLAFTYEQWLGLGITVVTGNVIC